MTNPQHTQPLGERKPHTAPLRDFDDPEIIPWVVEFRVVGTSYILRAPMERSFIVGRSDTAIDFMPDIDLTVVEGQSRGVSRRHVQINAKDNRLTVRDLGSANGTFVNGQRAETAKDYRIHHGQILTLGRLELQVNFIVKPSEDEQTRINSAEMQGFPRVANGQQLLIVDENLDVARVIGFMARQSGFSVTAVASIEEAITEVDRAMPQAIITELMFEVGEGGDLVRYVRERCSDEHLAIIIMTSAAHSVGKALQQGADDFLTKPLAADSLLAAFARMSAIMAG